ncbi:hypothetical protein Vadar_011420 [Vaccinium darrowii]|uniref:Uncharacterized protein n=1 Tax=Vaccinium darrowii TaxID=229202 RepID=A0ACB7XZ42_9ERIC|nr:hypothetical protein Vadar_011420 [Vaccinium darrowii]
MRDNVVGELQQLQTDDETKHRMLDILKRFHSEEEEVDSMDEDDDSTLSDETMEKILSGDEIGFDDLSAEEKKRFRRAVASGELSKLIEPWEPWWLKPSARKISLSREGTRLVEPLSDEEESVTSPQHGPESDPAHDIPPGPETPLPSINKLSATEPSPLLAVHLLDIIYAYSLLFHPSTLQWGLAIRSRRISYGDGELKPEKQRKSKRGEIRSKLKLAERKIYFLMCWVREQPGEVWSSMAAVANAEKGSAMEFAGSRGGTLRMQNQVEARGKALIEELE